MKSQARVVRGDSLVPHPTHLLAAVADQIGWSTVASIAQDALAAEQLQPTTPQTAVSV